MNYEWIGIAGTLFIILAFTFNSETKIRVFDAVGAALFIVYGALIGSLSNILLNAVLIGIHIYKLWMPKGKRHGKAKKEDRLRDI